LRVAGGCAYSESKREGERRGRKEEGGELAKEREGRRKDIERRWTHTFAVLTAEGTTNRFFRGRVKTLSILPILEEGGKGGGKEGGRR